MKSAHLIFALLFLLTGTTYIVAQNVWADKSPHKEGFAQANNIRLHYLDWGGKGEPMIFLTGMGASPHLFDDLAPKFTSRFRILGLTRRGLGKSDKPATGYDTATLTEDLRGFLDALKIKRATLVGWSLAGTEMTRFAEKYPQRVSRLIYLDSAYDYAKFPEIGAQDPVGSAPTKEDLASFESSKKWFTRTQGMWSEAIEADARAISLQPDGTMKLDPMSEGVSKQLLDGMVNHKPDFTRIKAPVLAFYALASSHPGILPETDAETRRKGEKYWNEVLLPEKRRQIERFKREVPMARVVKLDAPHLVFIRPQDEKIIVREMLAFTVK